MTRKHNPKRFPADWTPSTAKGPGPGRPKKGLEKTLQAKINAIKNEDERLVLRTAAESLTILNLETVQDFAKERDKIIALVKGGIYTVAEAELARRTIKDQEETHRYYTTNKLPDDIIEQLDAGLLDVKRAVVTVLNECLCSNCLPKIRSNLGWFKEFDTE